MGGLTRPSRQHLALFVNRRRVRVAALEAALEAGYAGLLPAGRHPVGAIFVSAPASCVDVNVHPSKEQVRLRSEAEVARALTESIRACLQAAPREPEQLEPFEHRRLERGRGGHTKLPRQHTQYLCSPRENQVHGSPLARQLLPNLGRGGVGNPG